jgi:hypothetical protein
MSFLSYENEMHQELALMALAASPTPEDACAYLKAEHNLIAVPSKLTGMAKFRREQYEELRERIAPFKEKVLTHNLMDNALYASEVTRTAMEQLMERLEEGKIKPEYLSRVARDVADVQAKSIDKKLGLEGRPQHIVETRSAPEIIKKLESMGVVEVKQLESG